MACSRQLNNHLPVYYHALKGISLLLFDSDLWVQRVLLSWGLLVHRLHFVCTQGISLGTYVISNRIFHQVGYPWFTTSLYTHTLVKQTMSIDFKLFLQQDAIHLLPIGPWLSAASV